MARSAGGKPAEVTDSAPHDEQAAAGRRGQGAFRGAAPGPLTGGPWIKRRQAAGDRRTAGRPTDVIGGWLIGAAGSRRK